MIEIIDHKSHIEPPVILSVVVPVYNEQEVLPAFHSRLTRVLDKLSENCEIIYIDDGSHDNSREIIESAPGSSSPVKYLCLSRNFGKEAAMSAGLKQSRGVAVVVIDADLQDPPELIPSMLKRWREGYDVVNMQRSSRAGESFFKRFSAACFYKLLNGMSELNISENVGDFRLLSREVVDRINELPERNRYMKGIFAWPGYKQTSIQFERDARYLGETKWNYFKLFGLAMDGISSFSIRPLRIATVLGSLIALGAFGFSMFIVGKTLLFGEAVDGYPSMIVVQLALGGVQLLSIGLLGEYIGRIFIESKQRPLYLIQEVVEKPAVFSKRTGSDKLIRLEDIA
ncbi:glycosyltransferase family 2 protein [Vibrio sp. JC009]|uniref:glycosyltransferase family 2 protein n=1 Tax=Vibrio sp. JC009 TaxID=2912314 RepID=UPI0023B0774D|nr:glycosyltransferase family 2 protein [Vibrio sp. JC009]WED23616.1 glycosyltransferase family 2 protein [Vibrio sp. JC009]